MHDLIIIGSGPAGLSAALCAKARNMDFLWFGTKGLSSKIERAEMIKNYPGLPSVTGKEMQKVLQEQIRESQLEIREEKVDSVYDMGNYYIACVDENMYEGRSVILAMGVTGVKEIPGEMEFLGKGVSYCATCDGMLYKGKNIIVICTDSSQEEEIEYLAELADQVTVFTTYKEFSLEKENIQHITGYPERIEGEKRISGVIYDGKKIGTDGIFILKESVNPAAILPGIQVKDGHILVDRMQRTNHAGCFAAGDCTGRPYQYAKAVGEGNVALHSVLTFLKENVERQNEQS